MVEPRRAWEMERRHPAGAGRWWEEAWAFDFVAPDGSLGGFARLGLLPNRRGGAAQWEAGLVGEGRPYVLVRDAEVPPPRRPPLEVRTEGLWAELTCEAPLDHWSVGLEAFGVAFDDPFEAWRDERGDRTPLGFDLGWEASGPARPREGGGYDQPGDVVGEVLVGRERIAFDGCGWRSHTWGEAGRELRVGGRLDDGTDVGLADGQGVWAVTVGAGPPHQLVGADGFELTATVSHHAPLLAADGGRVGQATCAFATADGRVGVGWARWPAPDG